MTVRRKKKVKSREGGQETTRPHTVSTHVCEPQLIMHHLKEKKHNNPGTHTFIWIQYRQTHAVHSAMVRRIKAKGETA